MGGTADFPERASSPLKRRASSMEPDAAEQDATEDVDMIAAPTSDALDTSKSEQTHDATEAGPDPTAGEQTTSTNLDARQAMDISPGMSIAGTNWRCQLTDKTKERQLPASLDAHVKAIKALVEEQDTKPLTKDQECFLISRSWLANVPGQSLKFATEDLSAIPPVDNSDIILEVIDDPCVGSGVDDILKKKFVRLQLGYDSEQFAPFPRSAWDLLMQWPGLKEGQMPIRRFAQATKEDGTNIMWEWHPPVLAIHRLWSAISEIPIDAAMKAKNPPPVRLVRSRQTNFQKFLRQAKRVAGIDLTTKVRVWRVPQTLIKVAPDSPTPAPPASEDGLELTPSQPWNHLLLDVVSFLSLESGAGGRELIDYADLTHQQNPKSVKTLNYLGIGEDQAIVLDPHESGTYWTSTLTSSQSRTPLPSSSLTVQNRKARSGRTSPISQGPLTRGRSQKSGRVLGCVGLANLGNTCYMNAALQCVKSVEELTKYFLSGEWEKELNKDNVLSHNGDVAAAYAHLLKEIYKDSSPSSVSPRHFKNTIGRYAPQFSGYGQQDSQEFLGFLLDGLQEDLSRIKKKPYIEKPDSTDDMVNDPAAIRQMAEKVWDITKKRDDSVIADLFTGLYKSTLVCPECGKVSITFDPFNNLTLPLPLEDKWSHTVRFYPLNDRPVDMRVELDKQASMKALKELVSSKTGVPVERLFGSEEFKGKFYKHYADLASASEEITSNDNAWFFELEDKPTNYSAKPQKQQKLGVAVRSMVDDAEHDTSARWDDERAERLLVPVFHRRPLTGRGAFPNHKPRWSSGCVPHFIMVTPQEARSEDAIRRKILEKVATFTKHGIFTRTEESDGSDSTDPDIIRLSSSDAGSSNEGRVVAQSVKGEDDMVDVHMRDASDVKGGAGSASPIRYQFSHKRPAWVLPGTFFPPALQNIFDLGFFSESGALLPTGMNGYDSEKVYPRISLRVPPDTPSSEDQCDNATNGTASNEDSSSDEAPVQNTDQSYTRMNQESDDEDASAVVKPVSHHVRQDKAKAKAKQGRGQKQRKSHKFRGQGNKKKWHQKQQRQAKERQHTLEAPISFNANDLGPDGGPLVRLGEALVVDWNEDAYEALFGDSSLIMWDDCETLPDPDLDRAQALRSRRRKNGTSLEACLDEFEREEILSEQDMWYCPRCEEHRRASKKFDLWKTPDILIIHLKRFSSSGFRRDKLEFLVDFPLENLDISSRVLHKEDGKQEVYNLIGVDCHWGGLGGGHYTAHAKNFVDDQWYTYNDSSVSRASPDRIVDPSAYLLFYRRQSEIPLGGPRFQQILEKFMDPDSSDSELPNSGEGQRLDEGSSQNGSSSALQGAEATRLLGKAGGNSTMDFVLSNADNRWDLGEIRSVNDVLHADPSQGVHQSIEEDEAIDMTDDTTRSTGFQPLTSSNSWNFSNLKNNEYTDLEQAPSESPFDSGAASDEAQHDSSGDERVLSPRNPEFEPELDLDFPGVSEYELPPQAESDPPAYTEPSPPSYQGVVNRDEMQQIWNQGDEIHEVPPQAEADEDSEDATEIHLDENDKLKLG
ncbi:UCH-domain-containing protein [Hypoxylon crocopeplum]|nr:UCH-domain-containing protein [Hypoxylon crocopeplum]